MDKYIIIYNNDNYFRHTIYRYIVSAMVLTVSISE